jgi:hypothetical protein
MSQTRTTNSPVNNVVHIIIPVNVNLGGSLIVGTTLGISLHPIDRAMFLKSIDPHKHSKSIFSSQYWINPMNGLRNTFYQRILSNGTYFFLQGEMKSLFLPYLKEHHWGNQSANFIVGSGAGALTGMIANASYAVKFYTFQKNSGGPIENAIEMFRHGGAHPFFKGKYAGIFRDMKFGATYELLNSCFDQYALPHVATYDSSIQNSTYFMTRFLSAAAGTTLSAPANYVRNMQFKSHPKHRQPHAFDILSEAWIRSTQGLNKENPTAGKIPTMARLNFFRKEFMIGTGTIRSATGMALGQMLFSRTVEFLRSQDRGPKATTPKIKN